MIERHAYQDTWGRGLDSYIQMMYERLFLLRDLLAQDGSIYVHLDYRMAPYIRALMDEIFGSNNMKNEIVWQKCNSKNYTQSSFSNIHDTILFYSKSDSHDFNDVFEELAPEYVEKSYRYIERDGRRYRLLPLHAPGVRSGATGGSWRDTTPLQGNHWRFHPKTLDEMDAAGLIVRSANGVFSYKKYLDESSGVRLGTIWLDAKQLPGNENTDYATQKPEIILERIVSASSNPGDLVLDCFLGSGTTAAVAEKLGRRWIGCDLGRFAIHTTRKRLLDWEGPNGERCRPFEVLNIGHYERAAWQGFEGEEGDDLTEKRREADYIRTLLALYHAVPLDGGGLIHGKKETRAVHIGPLTHPVSRVEAHDAVSAALALGYRSLDLLGWEWDFEANETVKEEARARGVTLRLIQVPEEMLDGRARRLFAEGKLTFPELASLAADVEPLPGQPRTYRVRLTNFIIPPANLPEPLRDRVTRWGDYIDYWSVDWRYGADTPPGERDTFHNMWQQFRTKKRRVLTDVSDTYTYDAPGTYTVMVKVVDIFGNDTTVSRKVDVR